MLVRASMCLVLQTPLRPDSDCHRGDCSVQRIFRQHGLVLAEPPRMPR
jgi:hypothetical protein